LALAGTLVVVATLSAQTKVQPSSHITAIDRQTGAVSAKVAGTGEDFQFTVNNRALLVKLKIGQGVYANFQAKQISLDGQHVDGTIVSINAPKSTQRAVGRPPHPGASMANTRTIDPCTMASAAQLQQYAAANIAAAVPIPYNHNGESVNIHDPQLSNLTCAPLHIEVRAAIHYRKTRGIPQGSASGHLRFGSPVVARIVSTAAANAPITSANFQSAQLCLSDITVTELNLHDVPNWLDNTWIREYLNQQFGGTQKCSDVSLLVAVYLQNGGSIP